MGIRSRLRARVSKLVGGANSPPAAPRSPSESRPPPPAPRPAPVAAVPAPASAPVSLAPPPPAPIPDGSATPAPAVDAPADPPAAPADDKIARHWARTRKGVLGFIRDAGGAADLAEMHAYSERRYFVGHKRFSDLMEELVDDGLITYDFSAGRAALTDAGRAALV